MNYKIFSISIALVWISTIYPNVLYINNFASEEITLSIQTQNSLYKQTVMANENHMVNTMNNSILQSTLISYDDSDIQYILVERVSSTFPQLIYATHDITTNTQQDPIGLYAVNRNHKGTVTILQTAVIIDNKTYQITDVSSLQTYLLMLEKNINAQNINSTEKALESLNYFCNLMLRSDKASEIKTQLNLIQSSIHELTDIIELMKNINQNIHDIQQATITLTAQTSDNAQKVLLSAQLLLQMLQRKHLSDSLKIQQQVLYNTTLQLQTSLQNLGFSLQGQNFEMLVPYEKEISTNSNAIAQMTDNQDMMY